MKSESIRPALCTDQDESLGGRDTEGLKRDKRCVASGSGVLKRVMGSFNVDGDGTGDVTVTVGRTASMTGLVSSWGDDSVEDTSSILKSDLELELDAAVVRWRPLQSDILAAGELLRIGSGTRGEYLGFGVCAKKVGH